MESAERAVLTEILLILDSDYKNPKTQVRDLPGLHRAVGIIRGLIRGDGEPTPIPSDRNRVYLEVEVDFEGSYYESGEMGNACKEWIEGSLEDRQDVSEVRIQALVRALGKEE